MDDGAVAMPDPSPFRGADDGREEWRSIAALVPCTSVLADTREEERAPLIKLDEP